MRLHNNGSSILHARRCGFSDDDISYSIYQCFQISFSPKPFTNSITRASFFEPRGTAFKSAKIPKERGSKFLIASFIHSEFYGPKVGHYSPFQKLVLKDLFVCLRHAKAKPSYPCPPLPIQYLILLLLRNFPEFVERYYSQGIYPFLSALLRYVFGWIPFSVGDVFYLLLES